MEGKNVHHWGWGNQVHRSEGHHAFIEWWRTTGKSVIFLSNVCTNQQCEELQKVLER